MADTEEHLKKVEDRLSSVEKSVDGLRDEVGGLRGEVGGLRGEVQKLRVLGEDNTREIKMVAEVQVRHGAKLEEIAKALEPLAAIHAFVQSVAHDHEARIVELEKRTGVRT